MSFSVALSAILLPAYMIIGAFDLGAGLLLPLAARALDRDAVFDRACHPWSTGAVWTLIVGALVVTGLPKSFATLTLLWLPLVLMLLSFFARGLLAALRPHVLRQELCDVAFSVASLTAAVSQGLVLGWIMAGLGTGRSMRDTSAGDTLSMWGLLCASGAVGLYALLGSGWLIWAGRGAVQVFGREVGRAAAILFAASALLCAIWALPSGVAGGAFTRGWVFGSSTTLLATAALTSVVPFSLSLWSRRTALPIAFAALSAVSGLACVVLLAASPSLEMPPRTTWLPLILLVASPLPILDLLRRRSSSLGDEAIMPSARPSHAGRRAGSLANTLHLS